MSGINLLLSTAKDALQTQQLALDVVSHNVANVNTPDYTRQIPILESKDPAPYAGLLLGRGVSITEIQRNTDAFIENNLQERQSSLTAASEKEIYMGVLEGLFDESSDNSLSSQMADFWNAWNDVANNPSGDAERSALYERGTLLCQAFSDVSGHISQLNKELNLSLDAGVGTINELTSKIADLNEEIVSMSSTGEANDLLDQRQHLVNQLSEYLDLSYYVNADNSMTVTTGKGYTLVNKGESYTLNFEGGNITWESSGSSTTDITGTITGGKMGGWLEMRDSIIPEYNDKLNQLAHALIGEVNSIHAQGIGLETMTDVTASARVSDPSQNLWDQTSGLPYYDAIDSSGSFNIWVYDSSGAVVGGGTIDVDGAGVNSLNGLRGTIDGLAHMHAEISTDGKLRLYADAGFSFAFSDDTSNALSALGINTFFSGKNANDMSVNSALATNKNLIAAGKVDPATGETASGDNSNAIDMAGLQFSDVAIRNSDGSVAAIDTLDNYLASVEGSIGIKSQSITRTKEYNEVIVNKLKETRNNISAVSLDEEMTQLIKFQHAYGAAAKLISTADEMYQTLLDLK